MAIFREFPEKNWPMLTIISTKTQQRSFVNFFLTISSYLSQLKICERKTISRILLFCVFSSRIHFSQYFCCVWFANVYKWYVRAEARRKKHHATFRSYYFGVHTKKNIIFSISVICNYFYFAFFSRAFCIGIGVVLLFVGNKRS